MRRVAPLEYRVCPEGHVALLNNKRIRKLSEKGGNIKKNGNIRKK
jgi:hypothetical protein